MDNQTKHRQAVTIPVLGLTQDLRLDFVPASFEDSDRLQLHVRVQDAETKMTLLTISIDDLIHNTMKAIKEESGSLYAAALLLTASELDRASEKLKKNAGALPIEITRAGTA